MSDHGQNLNAPSPGVSRRKRVVAIAFIGLCAMAVLTWSLVSGMEPRSGGKLLSEWATQWNTNYWSLNRDSPQTKEAEKAIRDMGTNAIPHLLEMIRTRRSFWKSKARDVVPQKWHQVLLLKDNSWNRRTAGSSGLAVLGDAAVGAAPELIKIASVDPDEECRYTAVYALSRVGRFAEPTIPFLTQCLTNDFWQIREEAVSLKGRCSSLTALQNVDVGYDGSDFRSFCPIPAIVSAAKRTSPTRHGLTRRSRESTAHGQPGS